MAAQRTAGDKIRNKQMLTIYCNVILMSMTLFLMLVKHAARDKVLGYKMVLHKVWLI